MPKTEVNFYCEADDDVPVLDWLDEVADRTPKAASKCRAAIERLKELGHELRRPEADILRDDIYELRVGLQGINYRILYFFHGRNVALLAHGLIKEKEVPDVDINRAIERRRRFLEAPDKHTYEV